MKDQEYIDRISMLQKSIARSGQEYSLLKKLIPDFEIYEDIANELISKYGIIKALKKSTKISIPSLHTREDMDKRNLGV